MTVVTTGESMALLTSPEVGPLRRAPQLRLGVAGAESNVAIGLATLGADAHWIGRVGDDEFGRLITETLRGQGVRTSAIVDQDAPTGLMFKERRIADATRVSYYRAGSAGSRLRIADLDEAVIGAARVVHLTGITPALSATARAAVFACAEIATGAGVPLSFDLNYRATLWTSAEAGPVLRDLAGRADIVFATEQEVEMLVGTGGTGAVSGLARSVADLGPAQVMVKRGERGAYAVVDDTGHNVPAVPVTAIDQVGAGDAFTAGYLSELIAGSPVRTRLRTAALAGAFAVSVRGDWEGAPNRDDLHLVETRAADVHR